MFDAEVSNLINDLVLLAGSGEYVYRGESECHERVSSGLYRQLYEINNENFDIVEAQERQIDEARRYTKETDPDKIVAQIQHLGGKTNMIDFTRDLNVALFFACNYSFDKDGRVIYVNRNARSRGYDLVPVTAPDNMADAQKSIFVRSRTGYLKEDDYFVYEIPQTLKQRALEYLQRVHGIETATVYNDISGFIRHQDRIVDPLAEIYAGITFHEKGDLQRAIAHYSTHIEKSNSWGMVIGLYNRGLAYAAIGDLESAARDFIRYDSRKWAGKEELRPEIQNLIDQYRPVFEEKQRLEATGGGQRALPEIVRVSLQSESAAGEQPPFFFRIVSGFGYSYAQHAPEGSMIVTFPAGLYKTQAFLWLQRDSYRGGSALKHTVGDDFTVTLVPHKQSEASPITITGTYQLHMEDPEA